MPRKILLFVGVFLVLSAITLILRDRVFVGNAQISIQTSPEATVLIDGEQVGTTPYQTKIKPKDVEVRLIPFSQENGLAIYETKVKLTEGVETIIQHSFGPTEELSSGYVVSFEKVGGRNASIAIVSSPESAQLFLDGQRVNTTPHKIGQIALGDHAVRLETAGYEPRDLSIKAEEGYELTAFVKLAKLPEAEVPPEESQEPEAKKVLIEILPTPTGFLRVREDATTGAAEVGRVTPGKKYPFEEEKAAGGQDWFKLEYETGKSGWVSGEYAKKIEESL